MRVLVVDRRPLFRDALAALMRSLIVGLDVLTVPTVTEAASLMRRFPIGLLILEADQAGRDQLLAAIRLIHPGWRIALLGESSRRAARPHSDGYLGTDDDGATVIAEVRRLMGEWLTHPAHAPSQGDDARPSAPARALTRRQQDVLNLLAQGRSTKDIARALDLGIGTIKAHLEAIYRTLGVHSRIAAVARAQQEAGQDPPPPSPPAAEGDNVIRLDARVGHRTSGDPAGIPPPCPSTAAR